MSDQKPQSNPQTRMPSTPRIIPLVIVLVCLFASMIAIGLTLSDLLRLIDQNARGLAWGADFVQSGRLLLLLLGVMTLLLVFALAMVIWFARRAEDERTHLEADGSLFYKELKTHVGKLSAELENERAQLRALLDAMDEGVIYSEGSQIRYTNRALSRLTGFSPDEVITSPSPSDTQAHFIRELVRLNEVIRGVTDQGGMWQGQYKIHRKDGSEVEVGVIGAPLATSNGHGPRVVTIIRDASQEQNLQAQKTRFISNTSHELKTPLANLRQRLHLLRKQPDKMEEHLQVMESVTAYMQQLIIEMLDVARFEQGVMMLERERASIEDLIREAAKGFEARAARREIRLTTELSDSHHMVFVDHKRIAQVFTNLISNAINRTSKGGYVQVRLYDLPDSKIIIEVEDDGAGIPPDMIAHVFQPFSIASQGLVSGTVLGLSLSREIVELHSGEITVESDGENRTCFRVVLPLDES
ncbi:MAG: PAS domain-containing sensor histidine kinase [Anaerolineae bacterium]|nr:PAS domain-containing sensor histidine kinase [Anaerolineae bacterium]